MGSKGFNWLLFRNLTAFWIFGLCNNYGYVIMLSAAEDIMGQLQGKPKANLTTTCLEDTSTWQCTTKSTGPVLIADNLPSLIIKLTFPFFMHRIPFGFRHSLICIFQTSSYFIVAFAKNTAMSLAGVAIGSCASGMGEITYLGLSSFYPRSTVAAWSSGTGGAGLFGSFVYAFLTEPKMANLTPKAALLVQIFIPVVFFLTYYLLLVTPNSVHSPGWNPKTWIVPLQPEVIKDQQPKSKQKKLQPWIDDDESLGSRTSTISLDSFSSERSLTTKPLRPPYRPWTDTGAEEDAQARSSTPSKSSGSPSTSTHSSRRVKVPQREMTFVERLCVILPLIHLMIPVAMVYVGEYIINQGLTQLIVFNCHRGFSLTVGSQYRWYQVLYQLGVFISRSSVKFIYLPRYVLFLLPLLQMANAFFFFFDAVYWFIPNIGIIFALIVYEGLIGGASYVNTFSRIHKEAEPDIAEYSLSVATVGDSVGVTIAGFCAIPLHNWVCKIQHPK